MRYRYGKRIAMLGVKGEDAMPVFSQKPIQKAVRKAKGIAAEVVEQ
jgi:hypothetical protein